MPNIVKAPMPPMSMGLGQTEVYPVAGPRTKDEFRRWMTFFKPNYNGVVSAISQLPQPYKNNLDNLAKTEKVTEKWQEANTKAPENFTSGTEEALAPEASAAFQNFAVAFAAVEGGLLAETVKLGQELEAARKKAAIRPPEPKPPYLNYALIAAGGLAAGYLICYFLSRR